MVGALRCGADIVGRCGGKDGGMMKGKSQSFRLWQTFRTEVLRRVLMVAVPLVVSVALPLVISIAKWSVCSQ